MNRDEYFKGLHDEVEQVNADFLMGPMTDDQRNAAQTIANNIRRDMNRRDQVTNQHVLAAAVFMVFAATLTNFFTEPEQEIH